MTDGHYIPTPDSPSTREQVDDLPIRYLDLFTQQCTAEFLDSDICLACYAMTVLDDRIETAAAEERARSLHFASIPQLNGDRPHNLELRVIIPIYGKPEQDMKEAQRLLAHIKTGVHAGVSGTLVTDEGEKWVEPVSYFI